MLGLKQKPGFGGPDDNSENTIDIAALIAGDSILGADVDNLEFSDIDIDALIASTDEKIEKVA